MPKGQQRGNTEAKKPKQDAPRAPIAAGSTRPIAPPAAAPVVAVRAQKR
ncbi:MAG: hypothetical protein AB9M60_22165 [Leptothrix sp. (in: b-proteobacteria)]